MKKRCYTYDDIHRSIRALAAQIAASGHHFDAMLAIGGGGFIPARMLRTHLRIPVYTVTLAYYDADDRPTERPQKIQWIDGIAADLRHKRLLVVDEVDDSRITLAYCLHELQQAGFTRLGVAVLHEKQKAKQARLPENLPYFSGMVVADDWIEYPWDADDIGAHNRQAAALAKKDAS